MEYGGKGDDYNFDISTLNVSKNVLQNQLEQFEIFRDWSRWEWNGTNLYWIPVWWGNGTKWPWRPVYWGS